MTIDVDRQNHGLVVLRDMSKLEMMILDPDISDEHAAAFAANHNEVWPLLAIDGEIFRQRVERGTLIGGYVGVDPIPLLETTSFYLEGVDEIESSISDLRKKSYEVAKLVHQKFTGGYADLTNDGAWHPDEENANVMIMVDLTTPNRHEGRGMARALVNYYKNVMFELNGFQRPEHLKDAKYALTVTPKPLDYDDLSYDQGMVQFHRNVGGAFNTGYVWENARPGDKKPDVIMMCYMAPKFTPEMKAPQIQRAA